MASAVYNVIMVAVVAAALWIIKNHNSVFRFTTAVIGTGLISFILALVLGEGAFGILRLLCYATFLHGTIAFGGCAAIYWKLSRGLSITLAVISLALAAVAVDAFLVEPNALEVNRFQVKSTKITRPYRIVVFSDFQTDVIGEHERTAIRAAMAENPDLLLMPGDYIQEANGKKRQELHAQMRAVLQEFHFGGKLGAFGVEGNCDFPDWPLIFENSPVTVFKETGSVDIGEIKITGLSMNDSMDTALKIEMSDKFHIVFGHYPDFALGNVHADLLIAGHTHGGQVQLPWYGPIFTLSHVPRKWACGMNDIGGGRTLVVSRGIGMERHNAPRLRFLCKPEIVVIEIAP